MSQPAARRRRLPAIATILIGTAFGQGLVILVSPLLTRVYGPSDFGALAILTGVSSVIGASATIGVDRAVLVAPGDRAVRQLVVIGSAAATIVALIVAGAAWIGRTALATAFAAPALQHLWWLFPCTSLAISVQRIASACIARRQAYRQTAIRNAVQGVAQVSWNLAAASLGPVGLVGGLAVGRLAGLVGLWVRRPSGDRDTSSEPWRVRTTFVQHRRYFLVTPWSAMLNVLGQQAPMILLAWSLGSAAAGFVALTMRVLGAPVGMVADAVAQWSGGAFGRRIRAGSAVAPLLRRVVSRLVAGAVTGAVIVVVFSPSMFTWVFGPEWRAAGTFAQILAPAFAIQVVASPVTQLLALLGRQATQLLWDAMRLALTSSAVLVGAAMGLNTEMTLALLAAAMVSSYVLVLALVFRSARSQSASMTSSPQTTIEPRPADLLR